MSANISAVGPRFEQCYTCLQPANEIGHGENFQAIGHLVENAECIHAVCLPCIQREDASRAWVIPRNLSMRQVCGICRAPLGNSAPDPATSGVQGRLLTLRCNGEIIRDEDMPPDLEPRRVPPNIVDRFPMLAGQLRVQGAEQVRRAARSGIEVVTEAIGRELVGRVVSLVVGSVLGAAFGMACYGALMSVENVLEPGLGIFVPREEFNGLSPGFVVMLVGGVIFGTVTGVQGFIFNPCGDDMERAGGLVGRAIVRGLEGLNRRIEDVNRVWHGLFVAAAQQPVG